VRSNPALLTLLTGAGYIPVVACMAGDAEGRMYNVNADQMAVACAAGFEASQLVFLTDVDGVLDGAKQLCPELTIADCERLISEGVATGGMQAKLNAAISALKQGVGQVRIAPGAAPDVLSRILTGEQLGTSLVTAHGTAP
jgi:acetylglutamate kinase